MPDNRPAPEFRSTVSDRHVPGVRRVVTVASPAAATDWSVTVPGGRTWKIVLGQWQLVTSSNAGNRYVRAQFTIHNQVVWTSVDNTAFTLTSNTETISVATSATAGVYNNANGYSVLNIPQLWLPDGSQFGTQTSFQTGDQYQSIRLLVEELFEDEVSILHERQQQAAADAAAIAGIARQIGG